MNQDFLDQLERQKNRSIASILSAKETYCDKYLSETNSKIVRKIVLDALNDFAGVAASLLKSVPQDILLNELVWKVEQIHEAVVSKEE